MKPLRIAFLKNTFHASGGLEKYCLRLHDALCKRGHSVTLLTASRSPDALCTKVCSRLRFSALNMLWFDYNCRRYLKNHPHDVIFGFDRHFLPLTLYRAGNGCHAAYLARRIKESSLLKRLSFLVNPLHRLTLFSEKATFERHPPAFIVCNSHLVEQEILQFYPKTQRSHLVVIHNGVEWGAFASHFQYKISLSKAPGSLKKILFIGHEWERKGLDRLLSAIATIRDIPLHLTAVGRERHPNRFIGLAKSLHIDEKVTFVPTSQDSLPYYKAADIIVIPSRYDPFANVTVEALAMGLFVVTTTANGGAEVITQNVNGIVLSENASASEMGSAIASACRLMQDPLAPVAIRESVRNLDFSHQLDGYLSLIDSLSEIKNLSGNG